MDSSTAQLVGLDGATCLAMNLCKALGEIAAAIDRQAEATVLLARATAGEFDQGEEVEPATDLTGRPLR